MFSRTLGWIGERWPVSAVLRWSLDEEIPGGSSFAYTLGSSALFVFVLQAVTGVWQMLYYVPSVDHAYDSVAYLRLQVPLGWLVHGLHYWGYNAFLVLIALHAGRVFIWGAYKKPRELVWVVGIVLVLLTAGMTFTGALLPWDQLGYWAGEVGTSIAGTVPFVGGFVRQIMRGGEAMGQMTILRFFILHVAILAGLLAALIGIHLVAFRQFGSVGPWDPERAKRVGWFWPDQVLKDLAVISIIFLILIGLSAFAPPRMTGMADPVDYSYVPKPEWNFLFLYQALKVFKGSWEPVGTVGIPAALLLILFLLPFYDRHAKRSPARRPFAMASAFVLVGGIIALTIAGHYSNPAAAGARASSASLPSSSAAANAGPAAPLSPAAGEGETLFHAQGCVACHMVGGKGGSIGPDLSAEGTKGRSRQWLIAQIRNPQSHNPSSAMPGFPSLTDRQLGDLADYLMTLKAKAAAPSSKGVSTGAPVPAAPAPAPAGGGQSPAGPAAEMIGSAANGGVLFQQSCKSCHGPAGMDKVPNPGSDAGTVPPLKGIRKSLFSKDPQTFALNIDPIIQNGSVPSGPSPALDMPAYGIHNTLTQPEIASIEAYILSLNGVNRAEIQRPGIPPRTFFLLSVAAFALAWLGLGVWWGAARRRPADGHP